MFQALFAVTCIIKVKGLHTLKLSLHINSTRTQCCNSSTAQRWAFTVTQSQPFFLPGRLKLAMYLMTRDTVYIIYCTLCTVFLTINGTSLGNTLNTQQSQLLRKFKDETYLCYIRTQSLPRSKLPTSVIKIILFLMYKAKVTVSSERHAKHINTM